MGFDHTGRAYANKTRSELDDLARQGVLVTGNAFSSVLVIKGEAGETERAGGMLLGGADGKAMRAAFAKLGYAPEDWCALACWLDGGGTLSSEQMRLALVTLDPSTVVACDETAAALLRNALVGDLLALETGRVCMVNGMRVLCLGGFEAALTDMRSKQVMWARLKQIPPLADPY